MSTEPNSNYAKLTADLLARQQLIMTRQSKHKKTRWSLFFMGLLLWIVSRIVLLKSDFKLVFDIFASGGNAGYGCIASNHASEWNLVLSVAYPQFVKLVNTFGFIEEPLDQDRARFLWDSIRSNMIPTQKQLDGDDYTKGLGLTPLAYLCGNILTVWIEALKITPEAGWALIKKDPSTTPWHMILSSKSQILSDLTGLQILTTQGFWGIALWVGKDPKEMYDYIFAQDPPAPGGCSTTTQAVNISTSGATFAMAGGAFGPYGAAAGAVFGLGMGLASNGSKCKGGAGCVVM